MRVVVTTNIPSPYQVELFNAIRSTTDLDLRVIYARRRSPGRQWCMPDRHHQHVFIEDGAVEEAVARQWIHDAEFAVISCYSERIVQSLLRLRSRTQRPWCLWGERPRQSWGQLGRFRRRILLRAVARTHTPIWGIGQWAIDGWRAEFGDARHYENVPYYSNLSRFQVDRCQRRSDQRTVLFSGSLIPRKGVDLLAEAFSNVACETPTLNLVVVGSGKLRVTMERTLAPLGDRVRFVGFRQWNELPDVYRMADFLCAPSRYDGWGLVVPEGLGAGLPVIGTRQTGAALELIRTGENGWLINAEKRGDLEAVLKEAATMPSERLHSMSRTAEDTVKLHSLAAGATRFKEAVIASIERFSKSCPQRKMKAKLTT